MRKANSTGTSVNDSARLAISDTQTDSDKGENRYLAVPCSRNTATNTMQMQSVESAVGTATSPEPETTACRSGSPSLTWRSIFSMTTVLLSTRMPTASAKPPSVIVFSVCPSTNMTRMAVMIEMGIVARMISVNRQLPRNSRIIVAVNPAAIIPPISTLLSDALTKIDWSKIALMLTPLGISRLTSGNASLTPSITASVETPPVLRTVINAPGRPSTLTELVWFWNPSWTWAMSRTNTTWPATFLTGNSLIVAIASGLLFMASE